MKSSKLATLAPAALAASGTGGDDRLEGSNGNDVLAGLDGDDELSGLGGDDQLSGAAGDDRLSGGSGNDRLNGGDGVDFLFGGSGEDLLEGGAAGDTMQGGSGNDTYVIGDGDMLSEAALGGIDTVLSSITHRLLPEFENLTLTGTRPLVALGNSLENVLIGNVAANRINGGAGADTMIGGAGNDTYVVENVGDTVSEMSGQGVDTVESSVTFVLSANVENLTLTGSARLFAFGNELSNVLRANDAGSVLFGGAGADTMIGGEGRDIYWVDNVGDQVIETGSSFNGAVRSHISYALGAKLQVLHLMGEGAIDGSGNALNNTLVGNDNDNRLKGGEGNDFLRGEGGADTMIGGAGNDHYVVEDLGDTATEAASEGRDKVSASLSYVLPQNIEDLILLGAGANSGTGNGSDNRIVGNTAGNTLDGATGNDALAGEAGSDVLRGGAGNDLLYGRSGDDVLTGGTGVDRYFFDGSLASLGVDVITDFESVDDVIALSRTTFNGFSATGLLGSHAFHVGSSASAASHRIIYDKSTGDIFYDADGSGSGAALLFANVGAGTELINRDFLVIN